MAAVGCLVLTGAAPGAVAAAPTPGPGSGPASAPSVRPAISPVPSPSVVAVAAPTAAATLQPSPPTSTPPALDDIPLDEPDWRAYVPSDQADHLATMDRAARQSGCGVPWQLLAAIARVESDFGRNMATSTAGAIGYGQFLPSSWDAFGNDGNAYDYRDVLPAIARYLCQAGLERDPRTALFAYNHADWYVDMVLDLAIRYDRLAPGTPTPQVLTLEPAARTESPMRFAAGRDLKLAAVARADAAARWLGVPWHGRKPGTPIGFATFEATTLEMLCAAFGCAPPAVDKDVHALERMAARAWDAGLLAWPTRSPTGWSLAELRQRVGGGQPVVALLNGMDLPGHTDRSASSDRPLLVIGASPSGLIVSDPSFSSSLGYGLEIEDVRFLKAWQSAEPPMTALGFARAPRPPDAHLAPAAAPAVVPRVVVTPPPAAHTELHLVSLTTDSNTATLDVRSALPPDAPAQADDWSWLIVAAAGLVVGGAGVLRLRRGGRAARAGRAAAAPPPAGR